MWDKLRYRLDEKLQRYQELERQMSDPDVAADHERYNAVAKEYGALGKLAQRYRRCRNLEIQISETEEMLADSDLSDMANEDLARLRPELEDARKEIIDLMLSGPETERGSLIMEVRAGTGGEEACLFARDLFEMYRRYSEERGWHVEVLDFNASEQRGFKECIFSITGAEAFRELQFESGGHRVQRVPETEAQGRIHTSAATVAVLAEPEEVEIQIRPEDIEMEATRSSGPGGQHVNKTSSAVRLTHIPSGLVVFCQEERSQHKNRAKAMRMLRSRLYDQMVREQHAERAKTRKMQVGSGDRSERIRTYNFPQNRCTDHRINLNLNLEEVIAGNLGKMIKALLDFDREERLVALAEDL